MFIMQESNRHLEKKWAEEAKVKDWCPQKLPIDPISLTIKLPYKVIRKMKKKGFRSSIWTKIPLLFLLKKSVNTQPTIKDNFSKTFMKNL